MSRNGEINEWNFSNLHPITVYPMIYTQNFVQFCCVFYLMCYLTGNVSYRMIDQIPMALSGTKSIDSAVTKS